MSLVRTTSVKLCRVANESHDINISCIANQETSVMDKKLLEQVQNKPEPHLEQGCGLDRSRDRVRVRVRLHFSQVQLMRPTINLLMI